MTSLLSYQDSNIKRGLGRTAGTWSSEVCSFFFFFFAFFYGTVARWRSAAIGQIKEPEVRPASSFPFGNDRQLNGWEATHAAQTLF